MSAPLPDGDSIPEDEEYRTILSKIWLDGFASGVVTAATFLGGMTTQDAQAAADWCTSQVWGDPAAMEVVVQEALNRVSGNLTADVRTFHVYGVERPQQ